MTAKEYLMRYKEANDSKNDIQEELEKLRDEITQVTAIKSDCEKIKSSGSQDPLGDAIVKMITLEQELYDKIAVRDEIQREIEYTISQVDDSDLRRILTKKYILGDRFENIAAEMKKSWRHTLRLHGKALQEVQKIIEKN